MNDFDKFLGQFSKVCVTSPYSEKEVKHPQFGGSALIKLQMQYFSNSVILDLTKLRSPTSYLLRRIQSKKNSSQEDVKIKPNRWLVNLLVVVLLSIFSRFDFLLKKEIREFLKRHNPRLVICNYPTFFSVIYKCARSRNVYCVLFEHNLEFYFFQEMLKGSKVATPFIWILRKIELSSVRVSKLTIMMSQQDKDRLSRFVKNKQREKLVVWIPYSDSENRYSQRFLSSLKRNVLSTDSQLQKISKRRTIVGFTGSNFEPNVRAVENIFRIAKQNPTIQFLIIGKVCDAFTSKSVPSNVVLKGFVKNLDGYLSVCDAFINPKSTSHTGIEMKVFDYLKFNKPVLTTPLGAQGLEHFDNMVVLELTKMNNLSTLLQSQNV